MAEERLIDDDKDKKYKIRINEDGEEELILDDTQEESSDEPVFAMPEYEYDNEEIADLTPEQLKEKERIEEEKKREKEERLEKLLSEAEEMFAAGDFSGALSKVRAGKNENPECGRIYVEELKILTRDMTTFLNLSECADAATGVVRYASDEEKAAFSGKDKKLKAEISEAEEKDERLFKENEEKKEERRTPLKRARNISLIKFVSSFVPFVVFLTLTLVFVNDIVAGDIDAALICTIVFAVLCVVSFLLSVIFFKFLWAALRDLRLNEKDSSTALGREYSENRERLENLKRIYDIFG